MTPASTAPCALCGRPGCRECPLPPSLLPPTPADIPARCVVCGRVTVFTVILFPLGTMLVCPGAIPVVIAGDTCLCWWCWILGWSPVRRGRVLA